MRVGIFIFSFWGISGWQYFLSKLKLVLAIEKLLKKI